MTSIPTLYVSQNVSWNNVELINEQIKGKLYKQIKCNNSKKTKNKQTKTPKVLPGYGEG